MMDIYERHPDVLCLSCYIWNLQYVEELVREIHKVCPHMPVWLGGPEVSYDAKDVLERLPEVTGVMMGEGEKTFAELCEYYKLSEVYGESAKNKIDIEGITFRTDHQPGSRQHDQRRYVDCRGTAVHHGKRRIRGALPLHVPGPADAQLQPVR